MSANGSHVARLGGLIAAIVLSSILVLAGVTRSDASVRAKGNLTVLTPEQVLSEPKTLLNQTLTVRGCVAQVYNGHAFALQSSWVRQGLLIVLSDRTLEEGEQPTVGQEVEVIGTLHMLNREEADTLTRRFGTQLPLGGSSHGYREHPYLLALEADLLPDA